MSVCQADPWQMTSNSIKQQENGNSRVIETFEDNFTSSINKEETERRASADIDLELKESNVTGPQQLEPLPDSASYLQLLERKLQKVQKGTKLLDSLQAKKEDCMRSLLASSGVPEKTFEQLLEFDTPIESGRLHRHLLPVQAVTVGETLEIVKYDELEVEEEHQEVGEQQQEQN
ncbi:PREDICTED: uncharacterized protein LOC108611481 [Drosophila arizonae]|uniref:Uncharacterized protein LOC108611481 n=1 Tax=Drosophila arizonae TaxID=7263 RepID=A0ABM1NXG9_DROAR|nr:PREDICTED: uncharacterized protein LOC108611481 [Drosophila arizonae]